MKISSSSRRRALAAALVFSLTPFAAAGCRYEPPAADVAAKSAHGDGIAWFEGSVEAAFAKAKAERRPVFLYWGAVWCPPCHILSTKLFTRPEFQARLASTVPVYLDGDTERAQIWGEKLETAGYPTVIVFDADGREVTRLNSLVSVEQYTAALAAALDATRPITEVVAALDAGGTAALSSADLNLLAFYAYYQDSSLDLDLAGRRALFDRLWREAPAERRIERSRFLALYVEALASEEEALPVAATAPEERARLEAGVREILADRELRSTNLDLVLYGASLASWLAPAPGAERDALVAAWREAALEVENDETLTAGERVAALSAPIALERLDVPDGAEAPPLSPALAAHLHERIRWAAETVTDDEELQGVMNTMAGLLEDAGLAADAKALLAANVSKTSAPYYYVGWIASLEEDAGNKGEAVKLYREAWQGARGSGSKAGMTPLRWGSTYLRKATSLTPEAKDAIAIDAAVILGDVLATPDAFAGGNWTRLEAIDGALETWRGEDPARAAVVKALEAQIGAACADLADAGPDSPGARCNSLLEKKSAA